MHYTSHKDRVIRIASHLFVGRGMLSESEVESIVKRKLNDRVLAEPSLTVDHIRVGLVEYGLLRRADDGSTYQIDLEEFVAQANIRGILGADYPVDRICGVEHLVKKTVRLAEQLELLAR